MVKIIEKHAGKIMEVELGGKLTHEDYQLFIPECERMIQRHGKIRILVDMAGFHGWEGGALWDDIKFDVKHFSDIEKIAMVGDTAWEKGMSVFCKPFTTAKIRYFDRAKLPEAEAWLEQN